MPPFILDGLLRHPRRGLLAMTSFSSGLMFLQRANTWFDKLPSGLSLRVEDTILSIPKDGFAPTRSLIFPFLIFLFLSAFILCFLTLELLNFF